MNWGRNMPAHAGAHRKGYFPNWKLKTAGVIMPEDVGTLVFFAVAAIVSILLGFSPKFGALILSIPNPVIGGLSIVLFGLISAMAGRIWVQNNADFSNPRHLITVGVALTAGVGDLTLAFGASSSIKFWPGITRKNNIPAWCTFQKIVLDEDTCACLLPQGDEPLPMTSVQRLARRPTNFEE